MSKASKLLVIGHSHIECLRSGISAHPDIQEAHVINLRGIIKKGMRPAEIVSEVFEGLGGFEPDIVLACLGGNQHNMLGTVENPVPFSVGEKSNGSTSPSSEDRVFIPLAMMEEHFDGKLQRPLLHRIYERVPDAVRLYLNPPPPVPDFSHIQKYPGIFRDKLDMGSPPKPLKMQLYKIQTRSFATLSEEEKAIFVDVDPSLVNDEGFLDPKYFNKDPTHGNEAYGKVMLDKILKLAASAR